MIIDEVRRSALETPERVALAFYTNSNAEAQSVSWKQLWERVSHLATALMQDFAPGARFLLVFPQGLEFHLCQLACNYAGLVPIPVPLPSGAGGKERLTGVIADSDCAGILAMAANEADLVSLAGSSPVITFEQLTRTAIETTLPPFEASEDDLAFIQYTSGSVSAPKGVVVTHGNLNANVRMIGIGRDDATARIFSWVPHFHDMGLIANFYEAMHVGGEFHLSSADTFVRRPLSWLRLLSRTKATSTTVPHFALRLCSRLAHTLEPGEIDLSEMRLLVDSSEPVDWEGLEEFEKAFEPFGLARGSVVPHYGLAECTVMVSYPKADRPRYLDVDRDSFTDGIIAPAREGAPHLRIVSCGRGLLDCQYAIVDAETCRPCTPDRIGEVWVTGSHVAQGYWETPEATAQTFNQRISGDSSDTLYVRTGDLGFVHDGDLYVTGRMKDVIIIRGQNYYARDIELLAEIASPLVREGRVVAIPLEHKGEETIGLIAEVAAKFDYRKDALDFFSAFTRLLRERFGLSAKVIALVRRNSLPRTTSGKIRRGDAAALYHDGELNSVLEYEAARFSVSVGEIATFPGLSDRAALRDWLIQLVVENTHVADVTDDEDLFSLGVDSLSMTNLLIEIEDLTQRSLLDEQFYAAPTLATLLDLLVQTQPEQTNTEAKAPLSKDAKAPPTRTKRGLKKQIAWRLREYGPSLGPFALSYGTGSRLLDRLASSATGLERLSRPFAHKLEALIETHDIADAEALRRSFAKAYCWTGWREKSLSDPATFARFVTLEGLDFVSRARGEGHGVILALVHSRFKGLYKFIPELTDRPFGAIGNLAAGRAEFYGMGDLAHATQATHAKNIPSARVAQIHKAHRILREGGTVGVFMDYFDGIGGLTLPVFGRKRPIRPGIAELALDTDSLIIPVEQRLDAEGHITIRFNEPFAPQGEAREERLVSLMLQQARSLDAMWRSNPGQMDAEALGYQLALPPL